MALVIGRDGYTNAELVALWPRTPNASCAWCWPTRRGLCTVVLGVGSLCARCLEDLRERQRYE